MGKKVNKKKAEPIVSRTNLAKLDVLYKFTTVDCSSFFLPKGTESVYGASRFILPTLNIDDLGTNFYKQLKVIDCDKAFFDNIAYFRDIKVADKYAKLGITYEKQVYENREIMFASMNCHENLKKFFDTVEYTFALIHANPAIEVPCYTRDGATWMDISPTEIITHKSCIEHARGRVLAAGLGLGYFAYTAALKSDVESVTVLEIDKACIELFEEVVRPQMSAEVSSKIKVIQCDAFEYFKTMDFTAFDYIYVDLWRSSMEIYMYYKSLYFLEGRGVPVDYWIESSFKVLTYIDFYNVFFSNVMGNPVPDCTEKLKYNKPALAVEKTNMSIYEKLFNNKNATWSDIKKMVMNDMTVSPYWVDLL